MGCGNCRCPACDKQDAVLQVIKKLSADLDDLEKGVVPAGEYHGKELQALRERLFKLFSK